MTLLDVATRVSDYDPESLIYATRRNGRWSPEAPAKVEHLLNEDGSERELGNTIGNLEYFLQIAIAKDVLEDWTNVVGRILDPFESVRALVYYAEFDSLPNSEAELSAINGT